MKYRPAFIKANRKQYLALSTLSIENVYRLAGENDDAVDFDDFLLAINALVESAQASCFHQRDYLDSLSIGYVEIINPDGENKLVQNTISVGKFLIDNAQIEGCFF